MISVKTMAVLVLVSAAVAQPDMEFTRSVRTAAGNRVDGDQFLYIDHRMSPFYLERSTFETTLEYYGGENVVNITRFETTSYGASDYTWSRVEGGPGTNFVKLQIRMNNVLVTQNIMKVFGFVKPKN